MLTRKMKESGIDWIGEVPEDWEISTIGSHYTERTDKVSDVDYGPLSVTKNGIVPQLEIAAKSSNHDNRKLVLKDDFVINSRSDRKMSAGISNMDGSVSVINTVLYSNTIDRNYTKYLLKNYAFAEEFYRWGTGIVDDLWSTKWLKMKNIPIPVPPSEKQKQIGAVIDCMFQNTNNIINETKQSITELKKYRQSVITEAVTKGLNPTVKMKESGIEWIGSIPSNWRVRKIKHDFSLKGRIGWQGLNSKEYQAAGPYLITGTDFKKGIINWNSCVRISEARFEEAPEIHIKENDLLITKDGTIGKVSLAINVPKKVSLNSGVLLVREKFKNSINKNFMYYNLLSNMFWNWYNSNDQGASTIQHLYQGQFYNYSYATPPSREQQQIVQYLDDKISIIDKLIENKTKVIKELENYKKSLIYEYVTGKKEM
ncbi:MULTISPECIES: restriction endonuclease subunit S [Staphylococcus]|uniref:restriction endonuclease subunit S n=1 Tax=Staphylococcus TaxID=1279 RepID=UPI003D18394D